jgi:hypothetical protein
MLGDKIKRVLIDVREHLLFFIFIVSGCAAVMSAKGAAVESKMSVGITENDINAIKNAKNGTLALTGVLPIAAEQNMWLSFKYALAGGMVGIFLAICLLQLVKRIIIYKMNNNVIEGKRGKT